MELDTEKIDEAVLGLLYLTLHDGDRAWKGMDWDALSRLFKKGLLEDPVNKAKSVVLTPAGLEEAARIFKGNFARNASTPRTVTYGNSEAEARSAAGVRGRLCRSAVENRYFFRVYGSGGTFTDYELRHDDLTMTIAPDELAAFYEIGGEQILDHSPEVLGLKIGSEPSGTSAQQSVPADVSASAALWLGRG